MRLHVRQHFLQCDEKKKRETAVKCDKVIKENRPVENYCEEHLPEESKVLMEYVGRRDVGK